MKQKKEREEGEHQVSFNVTIAKASVTEHFNDGKKTDSPQVQNYLHCQYKLLPDDKDFVKTDIVTFGMAAKMYSDNDSKVLRTWIDGDKTWIAWTNNRKIRVTEELLLQMFEHKFELKMWDTKDKVSAKARFDRPKAFRLPQTKNHDEVDLESIRSMLKQAGKETIHLGAGSSSLLSQNKGGTEDSKRAKKKVSFVGKHGTELDSKSSHQFINTVESTMEVKVRLDNTNQPEFKNLMSLASSGEHPLTVDTEEVDRISNDGKKDSTNNNNNENRSGGGTTSTSNSNSKHKSSTRSNSRQTDSRKSQGSRSSAMHKLTVSKQEFINQNGQACITVPLSALFTNCLSISNTMEGSVSTLEEVIVILSLDQPLLSDFQRFKLNPMVLTVRSAHQMPQNGLSYDQLKTKCHPPYVKYTFYGSSDEHRSFAKEHDATIRFNDSNVILLGILEKQQLYEYLRGPALKIEVHDRDCKEVAKRKASVFGTKPQDTNIFNTAYAGGTLSNLSKQNNTTNFNYGVAELDLSELLNGERVLYQVSPIRVCKQSQNVLHEISKSGIPLGDYLENDSELKIKVELVRSLADSYLPPSDGSSVSTLTSQKEEEREEENLLRPTGSSDTNQQLLEVRTCPYLRLVYIFDYHDKEFLSKIFNLTTEINAKSLNFWSYPSHVIEAALSTYKLSEKEQSDQSLDIITGCQIIDGEYHIFILEGLADKGVQRLWNELEHPKADETHFFRVLYNSGMKFKERLYVSLDVDLTRIRLHQPISNIVKQPFLYVRDMLPRNCFLAVTKLHELCQATSLQSVIRNETLPTVPMIVSLGREFGIPISEEDLHEPPMLTPEISTLDTSDGDEDGCGAGDNELKEPTIQKSSKREPLNMTNEAYEEILATRKLERSSNHVDYINANIKSLVALSRARSRPNPPKVTYDDGLEYVVYHNYSSQTLNSTAMALEKLRKELAKEPDSRFTFCQEYNSATVQPVNTVHEALMEATTAKEKWKTSEGFVYPGVKTTEEANKHPQRLDEARLGELAKPWRENLFHANILKPSVDRIVFKWIDRDLDFDTWKRNLPPTKQWGAPPVTIHAAGERLRAEKEEHRRAELEEWKRKIVVDDTRFHSHRCLIATELTDKGPAASNQIARKEGLLRDNPYKLALSRRDFRLDPIPPTACVTVNDCQEYNGKDHNVGFRPGDAGGMSWSRNVNSIPINDYQHSVFEKSKGHDFRLVHTDREKVIFKPTPLREEEKATHLFL